MRVNKNNISLICIFLIILLNENFFHLAKLKSSLATYLLIAYTIILLFIELKKIKNENYNFIFLIIAFLLINIVEIIFTNTRFGQPIILAVGRYKYVLIFLIYLPLKAIINNRNLETVKVLIMKMGVLLSIAYTIQAIIYPNLIVFHMYYIERSNRTRFYTGTYIIFISIFITFEYFFKTFKKRYVIYLIIQFGMLCYVSQTRSAIIALMLTIVITIIIYMKKLDNNKKFKLLVLSFLVIICMLPYSVKLYDSVINSMINKNSINGSIDTRIKEKDYMMDKFYKNPITGIGMYNDKYYNSEYINGSIFKYYAADVGVYGFLFEYGILGLIILIWLLIKMIIKCIKLYKLDSKKSIFYFMYILYTIIILPFNCVLNIQECVIYLVIVICMLEKDIQYIIEGWKNNEKI